MNSIQQSVFCKSVFKTGETTSSKEVFTKIWIELINQLERNQEHICCRSIAL